MSQINTPLSPESIVTDPTQRTPEALARVVVVGLGYVGLPLAILARSRGFEVTGTDIDTARRELIRNATVPDIDRATKRRLKEQPFTVAEDYEGIRQADIIIVCVPTPVDRSHEPDLMPLRFACTNVASGLRKGQLVIIESTVNPGTCDEVVIPTLERTSGLIAGQDFGVAHCPERVNPGDKHWPLQKIPRVVGADSLWALERATSFYRSILDAPVREMASLREAEAVKVVENSFRDINIAFVNEIAMSFSRLNIDVEHVLDAAATKPFGFMRHAPGCGVGGHCIPVDPYYLIRYARANGFAHRLLSLAREVNESMPLFAVDELERMLARTGSSLSDSTVAVLGLSYKSDVADLRESPSFEIVRELTERGSRVRTFDPHALDRSSVRSFSAALTGATAVIIATAHRYFRSLSPEAFKKYGIAAILDGRNCLDKRAFLAAGIAYRGIGR